MSTRRTTEIGKIPALVVGEVFEPDAGESGPDDSDHPVVVDDDDADISPYDEVMVASVIGPFRRSAKVVAKVGEIDGDVLKKNLENITGQLEKVLAGQTSASGNGFRVEEFKVGLAVQGKGTVYFVGELGVEASIELTFKRQGQ